VRGEEEKAPHTHQPVGVLRDEQELQERIANAIGTITREADGNVVVVSHGDVITAMLEGVVERRAKLEKYYVFHPAYAALSIVEVKDRPFLALYNSHRKMFARFRPALRTADAAPRRALLAALVGCGNHDSD
jgi:broad specificity phosphatase PhoE